jgi:hypothetical protein
VCTTQLPCPEIDLDELQSLKLLTLLKHTPSEVTKNRLSRTGIKILIKNSYYEAISLVSLEILCLFRYISTSDFTEDFDINHGLFTKLSLARKRTPLFSVHTTYPVNSFLKNSYIDCHSEIKSLYVDKTCHAESVRYCLNHFKKIKEIRIHSFNSEVYATLKKKLESVPSGGFKPHVYVEIGDTHRGLFSDDDEVDVEAWLYFLSVADSIKLKGFNLQICRKYQTWLTNHPQMVSKITECQLSSIGSDMKPFVDLFKLTLTILELRTLWLDLRPFLKLELVSSTELPKRFFMPESLRYLRIGNLQDFDFACLQDLPQLQSISLGSSTPISSSVDMKRFRNLEVLSIGSTKKLEIGKLPPTLKDFSFDGDADSNIRYSVTICSPKIEIKMNEKFFHKICFTEDVKNVVITKQYSLDGPEVFNFPSIAFKYVKDFLWMRNLNSEKFPCLENLRILDKFKFDDHQALERLLIDIFKIIPTLQRFTFELGISEIPGICQKIENSDVSAVRYHRMLEMERILDQIGVRLSMLRSFSHKVDVLVKVCWLDFAQRLARTLFRLG